MAANSRPILSASMDNARSTFLLLLKQGGNSNTITIVDGVKTAVEKTFSTFPSVPQKTDVVFDQSTFVKIAVKNVINEGTIGLCLTALMILLFLGNVFAPRLQY